jgi:nucleosome binding factor SPN SPT16 subunit
MSSDFQSHQPSKLVRLTVLRLYFTSSNLKFHFFCISISSFKTRSHICLFSALFAIELSDTLIAFCEDTIVILAASKKAKLAQDLADSIDSKFKYKIEVLTRNKADKDAANFSKVIEFLKSSKAGAKVGILAKEKNDGAFVAGWDAALKESAMATGDISSGISDALAVKNEEQLKAIRDGSLIAVQAIKKHVIEEILNLIDDKKEASMLTLMEDVEEKIFKLVKENKLQESDMEVITQPLLQSGGQYDLKYTAQTADTNIHLPEKDAPAVHIISISLRHKFCCCTVARTLFFNARKDQSDNYKLLLDVFEECITVLKPGVRLSKVYEKAVSTIKSRKPDLLNHLVKELGWGMGYELRDKRFVLDEKNRHQAEKGMIFCLRLGLENLKLAVKETKSQKYSILIQDTVIIGEDGAEIVTANLQKKFSKCSWNVSDEPVEEVKKKPEKKLDINTADILAKLGDSKTRKVSESEEAETRKLFEQRNAILAQEGIKKQKQLIGLGDGEAAGSSTVLQTSGYNSPEDFPLKTSGTHINVDEDRKTILVPINGVPVPFHISVVKNVTKQEQGGFSVIRINFVTPGLGITMNTSVGKGLMYLRELSYRSQDSANFSIIHKQISDMKKHHSQNENLLRAQAEIVPQEPLRLNPNRGPLLQNVRIYPSPQARAKKTEGNLEAHVNGFRFSVKKAASSDLRQLDFLYRNVQHAFFQPSNKASTIILLHFRLINPIMVGKTSTRDLQFYVEYMDEGGFFSCFVFFIWMGNVLPLTIV